MVKGGLHKHANVERRLTGVRTNESSIQLSRYNKNGRLERLILMEQECLDWLRVQFDISGHS